MIKPNEVNEHNIEEAKTQKFKLEINLGNDAMQTPWDVSNALLPLSELFYGSTEWPSNMSDGIIRDLNGNTVGRWSVEGEA